MLYALEGEIDCKINGEKLHVKPGIMFLWRPMPLYSSDKIIDVPTGFSILFIHSIKKVKQCVK